MNKLRVGFIGLGLMGVPMAKNILQKGFSLTVYNRTPAKTAELQKAGATVANSLSELARQSEVLITMVTAGKDVQDVLFKEDGVVAGASQGLVVIDMSTIGPSAARSIYERLAKKKIEFLDAPVTGSTPKAITGELTIFIGGKKEVFDKVQNILGAMGTNLQYIGESGSGQAIKLINNQIIAATIEALAEGMILADGMGLSRQKVGEVLQTVPATSTFMSFKIPNFVNNEYPLFFTATNMKKDLQLAIEEAQKAHKNLPTLKKVTELYDKLIEEGRGNEDMSILIKALES